MVMALGVMPSRPQANAKAKPIGLVNQMSSHSSVSFDFSDSLSNCL